MSKEQLFESAGRAADVAAPVGWAAWIVSHIQDINDFLQMGVLVASIFATVAAGLYHFKKWRRMG